MFIFNWNLTYGQDGGANRYINWHSAQLTMHSQSDEELRNLSKKFLKKYPKGLDQATYAGFVERIKSAEEYYRPRATKTILFQELVNTGSDHLISKDLKGFIIRVSKNIFKKQIDFNVIEEKRLSDTKQHVKVLIGQRLILKDNTSMEERLKLLEENEEGKKLKKLFGERIFEEAKVDFIEKSRRIKSISQISYNERINKIIDDNNKYNSITSEALATIIKAEQLNQQAAKELKDKIDSNNQKIGSLKSKIENLQSQNQAFKTELSEVKRLTLQNSLHIQAIRIAVEDNSEYLNQIRSDVVKIKEDVVQIKADVIAIRLKQEWDQLPLMDKIQILKTSNRFDSYFEDNEKDLTIKVYEAIVFREKVVKTFNDINTYGSVALLAMERFNIGTPALVKGLNYALTGASVIGNIYAQNYPAAAQSVLSLFGGGMSQESQLLQQVQSQLNILYDEMKVQFGHLNQRLDVFETNVHMRFDNLQKQLDLISNQLYQIQIINVENFALILNQLDFIQKQNACIQNELRSQFSSYQRCEVFYHDKNDMPKTINDLKLSMSTYGSCINALNQQLITPLMRNSIFDASDCNSSYPITLLYGNVLKLFKDASLRSKTIDINDNLHFLTYPVKSLKAVDTYFTTYSDKNNDFKNDSFINQDITFGVFSNPLLVKYKNPSSISTLAEYTLNFLPYLELYNSSNNQLLNSFSEVTETQVKFLKNSIIEQIKLCELSIIQNQLMNGMPIINQVEEILTKETDPVNLRALFEIIEVNPVFQRNFAMYLLCKYFDKSNVNDIIDYTRNHKNNYFSVRSINSGWLTIYSNDQGEPYFNIQSLKPFQISNGGDVTIRSTKIGIPIEEYNLGLTDFLLDQHTESLIVAKKSLTQALMEFDLFKSIPNINKRNFDKQDVLYLMSR